MNGCNALVSDLVSTIEYDDVVSHVRIGNTPDTALNFNLILYTISRCKNSGRPLTLVPQQIMLARSQLNGFLRDFG